MKQFRFGELSFDRKSIPDELRELSTWPTVDFSALPENDQNTYLNREEAIRLFTDDSYPSIREIQRQTNVRGSQIYTLFEKCITKHYDGRIFGFRALIRYQRVRVYTRTKPVLANNDKKRRGAAGAYKQFLDKYPEIDQLIKKYAKKWTKKANSISEIKPEKRRIQRDVIRMCKALGIQSHEYPLNQNAMGSRSLYKYIDEVLSASFETAVAAAGGSCNTGQWPKSLEDATPPITTPFEAVEFDGHKIDIRLTITIEDPFGLELILEIQRIWILVIIDIATRTTLGYHLALGQEYNKDDVIQAIQAALIPHQKRKLMIPGLTYNPNGGFPSEVFPELAYTCWNWIRFDNAKANLSDHTIRSLCEIVGAWPDAGPIKEENERPFVESFFRTISTHLSHRITGTTGSSPDDIRRQLGDPGADLSLLIQLQELEDLVDVVVSDKNGISHHGIGGRSPLEAISHLIRNKVPLLRQLPLSRRNNLCLLQDSIIKTVRGNTKESVRPHINFEGCRYSNDLLSASPLLIGKKLRLYYNILDLRTVRVFFENGAELGILIAARAWATTKHSLRVRKEILRLRREGNLHFNEEDDAIEMYLDYKKKKAQHSKRERNTYIKAKRAAEQGIQLTEQSNITQPKEADEKIQDNSMAVSVNKESTKEPVVKTLTIKKTVLF